MPSYSDMHRDEASVRGLLHLGGSSREVGIGTLRCHVLANGYRGPRGGESGDDIALACQWLAKHPEAVHLTDDGTTSEWRIVSRRPGFYRVMRHEGA